MAEATLCTLPEVSWEALATVSARSVARRAEWAKCSAVVRSSVDDDAIVTTTSCTEASNSSASAKRALSESARSWALAAISSVPALMMRDAERKVPGMPRSSTRR